MRGRQRLLWICTGLYTVLGGKNKGSVTSRVCVFPLWYSTIFPSYTKLLSYTSTQFSKSLIAPLPYLWHCSWIDSFVFYVRIVSSELVSIFRFFETLPPFSFFLDLSPLSLVPTIGCVRWVPLWYSRDYILMIWLSCVRISPAKVFSSSLPKVV